MNPTRRTRTFIPVFSAAFIAGVTASLAMLANAQVGNVAEAVSETTGLAAESVTPTLAPLSSSLRPITPWPMLLDVSQTVLAPQHDLLSYSGVDAAARKLLGDDYEQWISHFGGKSEPRMLESGLLVATGCLAPNCDMHKSLLIVSPANQKVYIAMVAKGKVAMWPSLMSWPDDAIPTIKDWLASSTDDADDSSETKPE